MVWNLREKDVQFTDESIETNPQCLVDSEVDNAYAEATHDTESTKEGKLLSQVQEKVHSLKIGRSRGRPRKVSKINNFFDFALKKNKKGQSKGKVRIVPIEKATRRPSQKRAKNNMRLKLTRFLIWKRVTTRGLYLTWQSISTNQAC